MSANDKDGAKIAWIIGAGTGIGEALALRLRQEGYVVVVSARRVETLDDLVRRAGPGMHARTLDVTDGEAVRDVLAAIERDIGPVDLAICSAGIYTPDNAVRFDVDAMRRMVDTNLMGSAHFLGAVVPAMLKRGRGQIALLSSVSAYAGLPGGGAYGATKSALITLAQAMYPQLRRRGIQLSVICPGFVKTPLTDRNDFPMPFMISAEDAANRIVRGLQAGKFEIAFPLRMVLALKLLRLLPYPLYFAITGRMVREEGR